MDDTQVMQYVIRYLTSQLKGELNSHNPSNLANAIEHVYLAESALKIKIQETVQHLDTINNLANISTTINTFDKNFEDNALCQQQQNVPVAGTWQDTVSINQDINNLAQRSVRKTIIFLGQIVTNMSVFF